MKRTIDGDRIRYRNCFCVHCYQRLLYNLAQEIYCRKEKKNSTFFMDFNDMGIYANKYIMIDRVQLKII